MSGRFDRYLWAVRLAKTRSKATELIAKKRALLNNQECKPSKEVKLGDTITLIKHNAKFTYKIVDLLEKRVGAKLVVNYLVDITPEEELEKLRVYRMAQQVYRKKGEGKPSKRDRRDIDNFMENWE